VQSPRLFFLCRTIIVIRPRFFLPLLLLMQMSVLYRTVYSALSFNVDLGFVDMALLIWLFISHQEVGTVPHHTLMFICQ
jgi:hypothetical protein